MIYFAQIAERERFLMIDATVLLQAAQAAAREAGQLILRLNSAPARQKEGHNNFVTETDVASQEYLRAALGRALPSARFFAEEQANAALTDEPTWVVDPLDGTLNFMYDRRCSSVSIALLRKKEPVMGVIYDPYLDEMYTAAAGQGAYCDGAPIRVSHTPFARALTQMGTSPYEARLVKATAYCFYQFMTRGGDVRRSGSAALDFCHLARGRCDVFFELSLSPWDYAAGALIVREAGGAFIMPYAEAPDYGQSACILCANPACAAPALDIVQSARRYIA